MDRHRLGRIAFLIGASILLVVPAAWRSGVTGGNCGLLEEVVNTGECVPGPGGDIARHKSGKLLDFGRCTTYLGRAGDEDNFHKNRPTSNAPFDISRDQDVGDVAVMFDDGTLLADLSTGTEIDFIRVIKKFYLNPSHQDAFTFLLIWPNFNHAEGSFHVNIKNGIRGLHQPIHDDSATYSTHNLESFINFRNYINFPADVNARIPGNNDTTMSLIAQETSHRWGAFVHFDCDPSSRARDCSDLLGRGAAHWCYFANVPSELDALHSSSLEGNAWVENPGTGTFTITNTRGTGGYGHIDKYLMGLSLPDLTQQFVIKAARGTAQTCATRPFTPEEDGAPPTVAGTRTNYNIQDIIRIEGPRVPDATMSPRKYRLAFLLLARQNRTLADLDPDIQRLNNIRLAWETYFNTETGGAADGLHAITTLGPVDMDDDGFNTITDCDDGDPNINPLAAEVCNHYDDDCDGFVDIDGWDADGDFWTPCNGDCNDNAAGINPNAAEILGNGVDDNCDTAIDNPTPVDADLDGYSPPRDCVDTLPAINPGAVETVDGVDNNCNGFTDCDDPDVFTETEKGSRATDGLDNDCNGIVDG